jgi:hypothetical protein
LHGNWESGISFIDKARLGQPSKVKLPDYLQNNKGKNHYYFLPLILGLIGMFFHFKKNEQDAVAVLLFFLFTGVLIIIYLNITPFQPRERDYAYVGSYYAFAIWIGLGVLGIYDFLSDKMSSTASAGLATAIALLIAPTLMASENWDDHDRSNRATAKEVAANYLNSSEKNAILFTNGDNDTFPLWYIQEVEGVRTDVRVANMSLLSTDWHINQMKKRAYESDPLPINMRESVYRSGSRDYVLITPNDNTKYKSNSQRLKIQKTLDNLQALLGKSGLDQNSLNSLLTQVFWIQDIADSLKKDDQDYKSKSISDGTLELIKKGYDDYFCRRCFVRSRWCNVIVVVFIVVFFRAPFESLSSSWRWWSR